MSPMVDQGQQFVISLVLSQSSSLQPFKLLAMMTGRATSHILNGQKPQKTKNITKIAKNKKKPVAPKKCYQSKVVERVLKEGG